MTYNVAIYIYKKKKTEKNFEFNVIIRQLYFSNPT